MIEAKDLRIGNTVLNPNTNKAVVVTCMDISDIENGLKVRHGIPLTPEVLQEYGYNQFDLSETDPLRGLLWMRNKNSVCHRSAGPKAPYGGFVFQMLNGFSFHTSDRVEVAYLHQLQNLTHALTGEELTKPAPSIGWQLKEER